MKLLISICLIFNIINQSYSQQRLNLSCSSLEPSEYSQGHAEGKAYGAEVRQATMNNFGIGPGTYSGSLSGTYSVLNDAPASIGGLQQGGGTPLEMALNEYQYWRADSAAEAIRQGPYCSLYNAAREDGFWAGYLGI